MDTITLLVEECLNGKWVSKYSHFLPNSRVGNDMTNPYDKLLQQVTESSLDPISTFED